jgi:UDP-N-acetylmuramoylalanine--D-glutamate ligase
MDLAGKRLAVLGMGRSGIGVARAAVKRGAFVTLFDQQLSETPEALEAIDTLQSVGVDVVTGWHGRLDAEWDLVVPSPGFSRKHPALLDAVELGIPVWSEVEFAYQIAKAPIIAITGTNGKSTVTTMTWMIANTCTKAYLCGNLSGSGYPELTLTEAADIAGPDELLVAEVSSYQLEWVVDFKPVAAAITNITPDHFDRHPNFEDYKATKLNLFRNLGPESTIVQSAFSGGLSRDEIKRASPTGTASKLVGDERDPSADSWLDCGGFHLSGIPEMIRKDEVPFFGLHNYLNACMAWELTEAALREKFNPESALIGLKEFTGLRHRMELIAEINGIKLINNSMCTNPAALIASSQSLQQNQHLLIGGNTKNLDFQPVWDYLASSFHTQYVFGYNEPNTLRQQTEAGFDTMEQAAEAAFAKALPGEVIMLAPGCASATPFTNFRERGDAFRSWTESKKVTHG